MTVTSAVERTITMTRKDWEMLEQVYELERALLAVRDMKLTKNEKEAARKHMSQYGKILRDQKAAKLIEKCFGDPAVLESMRVFFGEVSKKLA